MNLATPHAGRSLEEVKNLLAGATLAIYSVARPASADLAVDRSGELAKFVFATPAFAEGVPQLAANPVSASHVGTPGFARAYAADGSVIADFSAGPGNREIKFDQVSCSAGAPLTLTSFQFLESASWPERADYFHARPKPGYKMPATL